jgi:hypothetical protein
VGAITALLALLALPMFPPTTAADAVGVAIGSFGLLFGLILLLYASGLVRPTDTTRRVPVNPWLLGLVVLALAATALTQCPS